MIRDLAHVIDREKASLGLFVTLAEPTKPMLTEATKFGFYESPTFPDMNIPKLQILTIEALMQGTDRPVYPDIAMGAHTFKIATKENKTDNQIDMW